MNTKAGLSSKQNGPKVATETESREGRRQRLCVTDKQRDCVCIKGEGGRKEGGKGFE